MKRKHYITIKNDFKKSVEEKTLTTNQEEKIIAKSSLKGVFGAKILKRTKDNLHN